MSSWDEHYINHAYLIAGRSKDLSTQVGAVVVGPDHEVRSTGYNGPCRGETDDDPAIQQRPIKYSVFEHAERNCLYNMARIGVPAKGCTMYCTWGPPCMDCARGIVQSGITEVVCHLEFPGSTHHEWIKTAGLSRSLLLRLGVTLRFWSGVPTSVRSILCGGTIHTF